MKRINKYKKKEKNPKGTNVRSDYGKRNQKEYLINKKKIKTNISHYINLTI